MCNFQHDTATRDVIMQFSRRYLGTHELSTTLPSNSMVNVEQIELGHKFIVDCSVERFGEDVGYLMSNWNISLK